MADSTAARQIGTCVNCGGALYEYLVHHCSTSGLTTHSLAGQSPEPSTEDEVDRIDVEPDFVWRFLFRLWRRIRGR